MGWGGLVLGATAPLPYAVPMATDHDAFVHRAREQHDHAALARLLSLVEQPGPHREEVLSRLHRHAGQAQRVGMTGPPGAGKSTLVGRLALHYAEAGRRVGVLAVDPSSERSGGALLGDRVRMEELEGHDRVFVRSLATRGHGGGLSLASSLIADVLDACGHDPVFLETVGVGQGELDVVGKAHSVVLLAIPGAGDHIQLMKAGLLEMADLVVVNKGDREGAAQLATLLEGELRDRGPRQAADGSEWEVPVLRTTAWKGEGVGEVAAALDAHADFLRRSGAFERRRERALTNQLQQLVERELLARLWGEGPLRELLRERAAALATGEGNVAAEARRLAGELRLPGEG